MLDILSILLSVYPSTKGAEYLIAIAFLVVFIAFAAYYFKSGDKTKIK